MRALLKILVFGGLSFVLKAQDHLVSDTLYFKTGSTDLNTVDQRKLERFCSYVHSVLPQSLDSNIIDVKYCPNRMETYQVVTRRIGNIWRAVSDSIKDICPTTNNPICQNYPYLIGSGNDCILDEMSETRVVILFKQIKRKRPYCKSYWAMDSQQVVIKEVLYYKKGATELDLKERAKLHSFCSKILPHASPWRENRNKFPDTCSAIFISGHTDVIGGAGVNGTIASDRAFEVYQDLKNIIKHETGVCVWQKFMAMMDRFPLADNATEQGRQMNRRVELTFYKYGQPVFERNDMWFLGYELIHENLQRNVKE